MRMNFDINYWKEKRIDLWNTPDGSGTVVSILYTFSVFQAREIKLYLLPWIRRTMVFV